MRMGTKPAKNPVVEKVTQDQLVEFNTLTMQLAGLVAEVTEMKTLREKQRELTQLKEQVADYEIQRSKQQESFDREKREIQHHIGLEKARQEHELENARREALLDVREENLGAEKDQFEKQMAFYKEQMNNRMDDLKNLYGNIAAKIPNVNWNISESRGAPALEGGEDD